MKLNSGGYRHYGEVHLIPRKVGPIKKREEVIEREGFTFTVNVFVEFEGELVNKTVEVLNVSPDNPTDSALKAALKEAVDRGRNLVPSGPSRPGVKEGYLTDAEGNVIYDAEGNPIPILVGTPEPEFLRDGSGNLLLDGNGEPIAVPL